VALPLLLYLLPPINVVGIELLNDCCGEREPADEYDAVPEELLDEYEAENEYDSCGRTNGAAAPPIDCAGNEPAPTGTDDTFGALATGTAIGAAAAGA